MIRSSVIFCHFLAGLLLLAAHISAAEPSEAISFEFESLDSSIQSIGEVAVTPTGPTSEFFQGLPATNLALELKKAGAHLRMSEEISSQLVFEQGDALTIEAWVRPRAIGHGANVYVVGKGRTYANGPRENQNYALRLVGSKNSAHISFLFATQAADGKLQYHRWNSKQGFGVDGSWHHVAVSYQFGEPKSIRGYIDGKATTGAWDMAGATKLPPVVDDDAVWIGSSRGGDPGNSLVGGLDGIRIHRRLVAPQEIASRRVIESHAPAWPRTADADRVTITLHESLGSFESFPIGDVEESFRFSAPKLAVHRLPLKYATGGLRALWDGPVLMRAFVKCDLPSGDVELLLRSPGLSRLWVDGVEVVSTPPHRVRLNAHQPFEKYEPDLPWLRVPRSGVHERRGKISVDTGEHEVILESIVGTSFTRCEPNETLVAVRQGDAMFTVLGPAAPPAAGDADHLHLVDAEFEAYRTQYEAALSRLDRQLLVEQSRQEDAFWAKRHDLARAVVASWPELIPPASRHESAETNLVDRFVNAKIDAKQLAGMDRGLTDREFLRRASLDTRGVPPSWAELQVWEGEPRSRIIDQLLQDERWADHWTSYWQDVLAENPNILKPSLNNTGPFRYWIHDALVLNKPLDRFVTELIRMEGNAQAGGPKGFEMASENDVPMAEKAHVIASAFLAIDMKCARCHDAPYHPWKQADLFSIGAMLGQAPITVPETSSVPAAFFDRRGNDSPIKVTLRPGEVVQPQWPAGLLSSDEFGPSEVSEELLGRADSSRERLAAMLTRAENRRFAQTLVNRIWYRLMGWGLVHETDDWFEANIRHPELLDYLSRELILSGYDLKHLTRLILESQTYARRAIDPSSVDGEQKYAAAWQRRLSAEQLADSLHYVTGVPMATEQITFDPEGSQDIKNFLNLGVGDRAWKLASLSNERDRPSLNLPRAAAVVECLEAFGWRSSRQSPATHREMDANLVQPGVVANGHVTGWTSRLSDTSLITELAINSEDVTSFVNQIFAAVLTREPTQAELETFVQQLEPGFAARMRDAVSTEKAPPPSRGFVTWTNHFAVEANELARELERETAAGPQPTDRLTPEWRQRAEDATWALLNAPEFQIVY
ncbi:MAG: DUF1553 domain-containing protein [Pirellulaceae bacterium]